MINSIKYFKKECIKKFEELENEFMKNPLLIAEYITGLTAELHNFGLQIIKDSLESMDQMLQDSPVRRRHWVVESHTSKQLITSLGTVSFNKTLFTNKETGTSEYLLDRILGLTPNERITEDANKIHQLQFPKNEEKPEKKKEVDYLYIHEGIEKEAPKSKRNKLMTLLLLWC